MNIVVEGSDNSGKTTLVDILAQYLNWPVVHSDGPAPTADLFNSRARQYLGMHHVIFDRHCLVSERIYGAARDRSMADPSLERMFYNASKIVILCRGDGTLGQHRVKEHDTEEHLEMVKRKHQSICAAYDVWALDYANIIYRKGETPMRIWRFIKGELQL